jgi:diacylglycerol kinase (ATP)
VVAINPSAAFGSSKEVGPQVVRELRTAGYDVTELAERDYESLLEVTTAEARSEPDALVVVGGDGMVGLGANLLAQTGIPLGIVPSGTGNDMARGLAVPVGDTGRAISSLLAALQRPPRPIDLGRITRVDGSQVWFASVLSGGFDAAVNERANTLRFPRGKSRYGVAIVRELITLKSIHYELELDGERLVTDGNIVAIANNTSFGGGIRVAPGAVLDDGLFDVVILQPVTRRGLVGILPSVSKGTHIHDPRVMVKRAKRVRISAAGVVAYADGERVGPLPLEVDVVPGALLVLA